MDAALVVVNHDSEHRLAALLDRCAALPIVVVDNASVDGSELPAQGRDGVTLLRNEDNLGFAVAANQGAAFVHSDWIVFANPDTDLTVEALEALLDGLAGDIGVVAPVQVDESGRALEETGGHDPSVRRFAAWALLPRKLRGNLGPWLGRIPDGDFAPDWVSGAVMAVRRTAFNGVHGFDTSLFLYLEDADLCRRLRTAGWRVLCRPEVRVRHEVGQADPERRAAQTGRFVEAMGTRERGFRRRMFGVFLCLGYALRSVVGPDRRAARAGLRASVSLLGRQ